MRVRVAALVPASRRRAATSSSAASSAASLAAAAAAASAPSATGRCELHVRVLPTSSSGGHKFKILSVLLAQPGVRDAWNPPGVGRKIALAFDRVMDVLSDFP